MENDKKLTHFMMHGYKVLLVDLRAHFDPEVIAITEVPGTS
jgi:hypothetical protein